MNAIRKAAFAASALAITLLGSAFVTAPMAFARSEPIVAHHARSATSLQLIRPDTSSARAPALTRD